MCPPLWPCTTEAPPSPLQDSLAPGKLDRVAGKPRGSTRILSTNGAAGPGEGTGLSVGDAVGWSWLSAHPAEGIKETSLHPQSQAHRSKAVFSCTPFPSPWSQCLCFFMFVRFPTCHPLIHADSDRRVATRDTHTEPGTCHSGVCSPQGHLFYHSLSLASCPCF